MQSGIREERTIEDVCSQEASNTGETMEVILKPPTSSTFAETWSERTSLTRSQAGWSETFPFRKEPM